MRLRCDHCHAEKLVAFSCKKRGFCPSCGARRMAETAALLADEVLPLAPLGGEHFDLHCSIMSLPSLLGLTLEGLAFLWIRSLLRVEA